MIKSNQPQFREQEIKGTKRTFRKPINHQGSQEVASKPAIQETSLINQSGQPTVFRKNYQLDQQHGYQNGDSALNSFRLVYFVLANTNFGCGLQPFLNEIGCQNKLSSSSKHDGFQGRRPLMKSHNHSYTLTQESMILVKEFMEYGSYFYSQPLLSAFKEVMKFATFSSTSIELFRSSYFKVKIQIMRMKKMIFNIPVKEVFEDLITAKEILSIVSKYYPGVKFKWVKVFNFKTKKFSIVHPSLPIKLIKDSIQQGRHLNLTLELLPSPSKLKSKKFFRKVAEKEFITITEGRREVNTDDPASAGNKTLTLLEEIKMSLDSFQTLPRFLVVNVEGVKSKACKTLLRKFFLKDIYPDHLEIDKKKGYSWRLAITTDSKVIKAPDNSTKIKDFAFNSLQLWKLQDHSFSQHNCQREELLKISQIVYELC